MSGPYPWSGTPNSDGIPIEGGLLWRSLMGIIHSEVKKAQEDGDSVEATFAIMEWVRHAVDSATCDAWDTCPPGTTPGVEAAEFHLGLSIPRDARKAVES